MQENLRKDYQAVIHEVTQLLSSHPDWQQDFARYLNAIQKHEAKLKPPVSGYLKEYTTISLEMQTADERILRYKGQEVAHIRAEDGGFNVYITSKNAESNKAYFASYDGYRADVLGQGTSYPWVSEKGDIFRAFFAHPDMDTKSKEHAVESALISDLEQMRSENKTLTNIQPIKLNGRRFQMKTPLKASSLIHGTIAYSGGNGGGIDILARYRNGFQNHLVVIELKDSYEESEPPCKVMTQAIAYATFLAKLMESPSGAAWYQAFGFHRRLFQDTDDGRLVIKCVVAMPDIKDMQEFDDGNAAAWLEIDDKVTLELGCICVADGKVERYSRVFR